MLTETLRARLASGAGGDQVLLRDGSLSLVWDAVFRPGLALTKVKYAPPGPAGRRKLPHSFTDPLRYQQELHALGWDRDTGVGGRAAVVGPDDMLSVLPALPLAALPPVPGPVLTVLARAGVDPSSVRVTGSRAVGLQHAGSDRDLVVPADGPTVGRARTALLDAVGRGELAVPPASGNWRLLDRLFPGGRDAILRGRRYLDTVQSGGVSVALLFTGAGGLCLDAGWRPAGRAALTGTVRDAAAAGLKRAGYVVDDERSGEVRVVCYHKSANLLRAGDVVTARGWLVRRGEDRLLVQLLPQPDGIAWLEAAPLMKRGAP